MGTPEATRSVAIDAVRGGVVATLAMDAAMVLAATLAPGGFASEKMSPGVIGRWGAGLVHGRLRQRDVSEEPRVTGEFVLGMVAHYATGIMLTGLYRVAGRHAGLPWGLPGATAYGLATAVLPLLVMYPSMGYGICAHRSEDGRRLVNSMLLGHVAFGAGIGLTLARTGQAPTHPES